MRRTAILLILLTLTGCHRSGTWEDHPQNFERIFRVSQPKDLFVVHSRFWRSAHGTYEFEYFIQIQRNEDFRKRLFKHNPLKRVEAAADLQRVTDFFSEKPAWFLPKPLPDYEIWMLANDSHSNFKIFIDRATADLFLTDYQV
jgi:hypothetical protein